jgi:putative ABC transport system permease protein
MKKTLTSQNPTALSISQALKFSYGDMIARGTRSKIVAFSILLSVTFMVFLSVTASIFAALTGEAATVQTHYFLMEIIALLVCLVGVTNTMLMSVTERFKEIGTMKCLGARDTHVVLIFLFEALILASIGGIGGALTGLALGVVVSGLQVGWATVVQVPLQEHVAHVLRGIFTAVLLGQLGSIYPAYYVARLKPAEALRHEL